MKERERETERDRERQRDRKQLPNAISHHQINLQSKRIYVMGPKKCHIRDLSNLTHSKEIFSSTQTHTVRYIPMKENILIEKL